MVRHVPYTFQVITVKCVTANNYTTPDWLMLYQRFAVVGNHNTAWKRSHFREQQFCLQFCNPPLQVLIYKTEHSCLQYLLPALIQRSKQILIKFYHRLSGTGCHCKHLDHFYSVLLDCIYFWILACDLLLSCVFSRLFHRSLHLGGICLKKKQVKIYLNIITVWPVCVLDVAKLTRHLSGGLFVKTHKHRKCSRGPGSFRPLWFALSSDFKI